MLNFLSSLGLLAMIGGGVGAFTRAITPTLGLYLMLGGLAWIALLSLPAILLTMKWGRNGMPSLALYLGVLALAGAAGLGFLWYQHPINDLTSNTIKPPPFLRPVYQIQPERGAEFLDPSLALRRDYPSEFAGIQNTHYSGFETISARLPLADAQPVIETAIKTAFPDWRIVHTEKSYPHVEAEVENPYLHFIDDVVVEARESKNSPNQIMVDYRIRSRFPYGDLGMSAQRMAQLRAALEPELTKGAEKYAEFQKNYAKPAAPAPAPTATAVEPPAAAAPAASPPPAATPKTDTPAALKDPE